MKYILEVSEEQAEVIKIALEEYFRLRMNQTGYFADDICFDGFDYKNHTEDEFNYRIMCRDLFQDKLKNLWILYIHCNSKIVNCADKP